MESLINKIQNEISRDEEFIFLQSEIKENDNLFNDFIHIKEITRIILTEILDQ